MEIITKLSRKDEKNAITTTSSTLTCTAYSMYIIFKHSLAIAPTLTLKNSHPIQNWTIQFSGEKYEWDKSVCERERERKIKASKQASNAITSIAMQTYPFNDLKKWQKFPFGLVEANVCSKRKKTVVDDKQWVWTDTLNICDKNLPDRIDRKRRKCEFVLKWHWPFSVQTSDLDSIPNIMHFRC